MMYTLASGRMMQGVRSQEQIKNIQMTFSDGIQMQVGNEKIRSKGPSNKIKVAVALFHPDIWIYGERDERPTNAINESDFSQQ